MPASVVSLNSESSYASSNNSNAEALAKGQGPGRNEEDDELDHASGWLDNMFGAVYLAQTPHEQTLSFKTGMASSLTQSVQLLYLLFNPFTKLLVPDEQLWVYKYTSWALVKLPVLNLKNYTIYMALVYVLLGLLVMVAGSIGWIATAIKNDEQERKRYRKVMVVLRPAAGLLFLVFPVAIMDLLGGAFHCSWETYPQQLTTVLWGPDRGDCLQKPHVVHASFAAVAFALYALCSMMMAVGTCEQNPLSAHMSCSPNMSSRLKVAVVKVALVICAGQLTSKPFWQTSLCLLLSLYAFQLNLRQAPYYRTQTNHLHCGLWLGMAYVACVEIAMLAIARQTGGLTSALRDKFTKIAGIGVMPAGFSGIGISILRQVAIKAELHRIRAAPLGTKPRHVLRLKGCWHVELLSRCVRGRDKESGKVDPDALALAEQVIQMGVAVYGKADPEMLTLQAAFNIFVHHDIQQARMQLAELSGTSSLGLLQAYGQYCCQQYIRVVKDAGSDGGMDLASYVEFNRHYRSAIHAHRLALQAQRMFWRTLMSERVRFADLEEALDQLGKTEQRAMQVYRRVLERYSTNAKLLKVYGRFVEEVQHDPWRANKYYSDSERQVSSDTSMDLKSMVTLTEGADMSSSDLDARTDSVIIINAAGLMMSVNQVACSLLGYRRIEMEERNVAMIIPPPFAEKHNSYLERFITTQDPHVVGYVRPVVAVHKDRHLVPVNLAVTRMAGTGHDSVFLGVMKPATRLSDVIDIWAMPRSGMILTVDNRFEDWFGYSAAEVTEKTVARLGSDNAALAEFVATCSSVSYEQLSKGDCKISTHFNHKFLDQQVQVEITATPGGTYAHTLLILKVRRATAAIPMAVVTHKLAFSAVSNDFAGMLGYNQKQLLKMSLADVIPPPISELHGAYIKHLQLGNPPPALSCRAGLSVMMLTRQHEHLPVTLTITSKEEPDGMRHVVQAKKCKPDCYTGQRRIHFKVDRLTGTVMEVDHSSEALFDWPPNRLIGRGLLEALDIFAAWEDTHGPGSTPLLLQTLLASSTKSPGESWRVGVRHVKDREGAACLSESGVGGSSSGNGWDAILRQIQGKKLLEKGLIPGMIQVIGNDADSDVEGYKMVNMVLWRADVLSGFIEVDPSLRVVKADEQSAIILGTNAYDMRQHALHRFISLPTGMQASHLLQSESRCSMKKQRVWVVGKARVESSHHHDGQPMTVQVQAVARGGTTAERALVHIRIVSPSCCSPQVLQVLANEAHTATDWNDGASDRSAGPAERSGGKPGPLIVASEGDGIADGGNGAGAEDGWAGRLSNWPAGQTKHALKGAVVGKASGAGRQQVQQDSYYDQTDYADAVTDEQAAELVADLVERHGSDDDEQRAPAAAGVGTHQHWRVAQQHQGPAGSSQTVHKNKGGGGTYNGHRGAAAALEEEGEEQALLAQQQLHSDVHAAAAAAWSQGPAAVSHSHGRLGSNRVQGRPDGGDDDFGFEDDETGGEVLGNRHAPASTGARPGPAAAPMAHRRGLAAAAVDGDDNGLEEHVESASVPDSFHGMDDAASSGVQDDGGGSEEELHADARRAKRLKRLLQLMTNSKSQDARQKYMKITWLLLAVMLAVHVGCYVLFSNEILSQHEYVTGVQKMALTTDAASLAAVRGFIVAKCQKAQYTNNSICDPDTVRNSFHKGLQAALGSLVEGHRGTYLGYSYLHPIDSPDIYELWTLPNTVETVYMDTSPPSRVKQNNSLWAIGNHMIAAVRQVIDDTYLMGEDLDTSRHWQYLQDQGTGVLYDQYTLTLDRLVTRAYDRLSAVASILVILLVVEAFGVTLACVAYNWVLIRNMARHHMLVFTSFLTLPSALLRSMASRPCVVDDQEGQEEEDEGDFMMEQQGRSGRYPPAEEATGQPARAAGGKQVRLAVADGAGISKAGAGKKAVNRLMANRGTSAGREKFWRLLHAMTGTWGGDAHHSFKVNGRRLLPSRRMELQSMALFVVFQLLLVLIYALSFSRLGGLVSPISQLNTAQHLVYRSSRTRVFAVNLAFSSTAADRAKWRSNLERSCTKLGEEYQALMFGGVLEWISTTIRSSFRKFSPAVVFNDRETAMHFFAEQSCERLDASTCFPPGHEYYEVTHNGINAQMQRYLDECRLFRTDPDSAINPSNKRYDYMWRVGAKDLYEAILKLSGNITANTIEAYEEMRTLHMVLLLLSIALPIVHLLFVYRPMLKKTKWQMVQVAGLLSLLPAEVDVEQRLRAALAHNRSAKDAPADSAADVAGQVSQQGCMSGDDE